MHVSSRFRAIVRGLLAMMLVVTAGYAACAQTMMLAEPPTPLLPESLRSGPGHDAGNGVPPWAVAAGQVLVEDGIKRYERGTPPNGTVTVYQFGDATGAVAAYDYLRTSAPYVVQNGVSVVVADLKGNPASSEALLRTVQTGLPKVGGPRGIAPLLPTLLPGKGLEKDTVHYALGPQSYQAMGGVLPAGIIGFDKAAEVVTAKYAGKGTLTLLLYPTPQIAGDHGRQIEAEMNREGATAGTVKLRREGPLLLLTTGTWKAADAQKTVEGIHLHNQVTWDKPVPPEFHAEIRKTVSLLSSILIFCGLGALAAVVLGLFFGGGRAAIRVLQGKPAASEPEFLRIDLSGSRARIRTESSESSPQR
jgi:hypothetical protein